MGKEDERAAKSMISEEKKRSSDMLNKNVGDINSRIGEIQAHDTGQRNTLTSKYESLAPTGGLNQELYNKLNTSTKYSSANRPSYLNTFDELSKSGGARAADYSNLNSSMDKMNNMDYSGIKDASSGLKNIDFSGVDSSANKLNNIDYSNSKDITDKLKAFAATGGIDSNDMASVNRDSLLDFENTGGYTSDDIANTRARSNSVIPSYFENLKRGIDRQRVVSGQSGPGVSASNFAMARQAAQGAAENARNTELDINEKVRNNKMAAGQFLSGANQNMVGMRTGNTLAGYGTAGNIDLARTGQEGSNAANAGQLSLGKTGQQAQNLSASGNLESDIVGKQLGAQANIGSMNLGRESQLDSANQAANNTRLSATGALTSDDLARTSLDSNNTRALSELQQRGTLSGIEGLAQMYGMDRNEAMNLRNMLMQYYGSSGQQGQGLIGQRMDVSRMPGIMDDIMKGVKIGGSVLGGVGGAMG